ncbi:MAG: adenylate/guanylate cyclase domain-containing protein [Synechococcales cyanobacterium RM1_1_8]|nr:adenylate/guanylate cyclase domain-containing protein [Synechococcales cyanobacterium RM1_1_8]
MTVMFVDIRGFATLSEAMTPQENFDFVNAYFQRVSPEVRGHQGFIVKYLGDGLMAIFPERAEDAIAAGIAQLQQMQQFEVDDFGLKAVHIGIGIHHGPMMVGIVGEAQRMQGDAFSDDVNLASRLEGLTKFYGVSMLISEQVLAQLGADHPYQVRELDRVTVKGRSQPLRIYEVFDGDPSQTRYRKAQTRRHFEAGIHCYQVGDFVAAQGHFRAVLQIHPEDKPAQLYGKRLAGLLSKPPKSPWTGVSEWGRK